MYWVLVLLIASFISNIEGHFFRSDYVFHDVEEVWTKYHLMPAKWEEARLRCFFEGSTLLSPISQGLLHVMRKVHNNNNLPVFTGFSSTHFNGDYYSIEGVSLEHLLVTWAPGKPNNPGDEQCIAMYSNGTLADLQCDRPLPYICYKRYSKNIHAASVCGTVDPGYEFDKRTGHCYKVHKYGQTWGRAFLACSAEGGYLAIINNDEEAQVLRELMARYPNNKLQSHQRNVFGIGFHDWSEHGVFMTIHGETLQEAGYAVWGDGQPDNAAPGEYCGSVLRDAKLNDVGCKYTIAFICEKEPGKLLESEKSGFDEIDVRFENLSAAN